MHLQHALVLHLILSRNGYVNSARRTLDRAHGQLRQIMIVIDRSCRLIQVHMDVLVVVLLSPAFAGTFFHLSRSIA